MTASWAAAYEKATTQQQPRKAQYPTNYPDRTSTIMAFANHASDSGAEHLSRDFLHSLLVNLFIRQLLHGCARVGCTTQTCYSFQRHSIDRPSRKLTTVSAQATAFYLASLPNVESHLCPGVVEEALEFDEEGQSFRLKNDGKDTSTGPSLQIKARLSHRKDPFSFPQRLFGTEAVKTFLALSGKNRATVMRKKRSCEIDHQQTGKHHVAMVKAEETLAALLPRLTASSNFSRATSTVMSSIFALTDPIRTSQAYDQKSHRILDSALLLHDGSDEVGLRLATTLTLVLDQAMFGSGDSEETTEVMRQLSSTIIRALKHTREGFRLSLLLAWWVQRVFLRYWHGSCIMGAAEVPAASLRVLGAIRDVIGPSVLDQYFCVLSKYQPDVLQLALDYVKALKNETTNVELVLNYPWVFLPSVQSSIFRALCFCRMSEAVDGARLNFRVMSNAFSVLVSDGHLPPQMPSLQIGRLHIALSRFLGLKIDRHSILPHAFDWLWRRQKRELFLPIRVQMRNVGELGVDQGGLAQEFFRLSFIEALDPSYSLFTIDEKTRMAWFDPKSLEPVYKFELLGLIFALAIYNGFTLPVTFPEALYRKLLQHPVRGIHHIRSGWQELAAGLDTLLKWEDGDVADVFMRTYTFTFEGFGNKVHVDMTKKHNDNEWSPISAMANNSGEDEDAALVTNNNRTDYVIDYIHWLTDKSVRRQFQAFEKGFLTIFDRKTLKALTPASLQTLVEGHRHIDTRKLQAFATYDGYEADESYIQNFWNIVHSFNQEKRRKLLEFVTATDRVPVNGINSIDFKVQLHEGGDSERLPTSSTCFGILFLPKYSSVEKLETKLAIALDNARGFGLS